MKAAVLLACMACAIAMSGEGSIEAARELIAKGSPQAAVEMLRPIVSADPRNADARLLLGTALALEGARSESIQQLIEAVKLRPDSASAYNTLGMAYSRFVELNAARAAFEKAIQLDPGMADPHVNLALLLAQLSDWAPAVQHLDRAIAIQGAAPAAAKSYCLRAKIRGEQNDLERALADLEQAVRLRPDFAEAWSELGVARRASLDETGALAAFEQAVRLDPGNTTAQFRLGSEYLHAGKAHQAAEHLKLALVLDPEDRAILYNLQRALREDGQTEEAGRIASRMADILRQRSRASEMSLEAVKLNNQGVELEKSGNLNAALEKYRAALDLNPEHGGFRMNLGLVLCRLGKWDEGIAEMREVVRREPNNAEAAKSLYIALEQRPKR